MIARTPGSVQAVSFLLVLPLSFGSNTFVPTAHHARLVADLHRGQPDLPPGLDRPRPDARRRVQATDLAWTLGLDGGAAASSSYRWRSVWATGSGPDRRAVRLDRGPVALVTTAVGSSRAIASVPGGAIARVAYAGGRSRSAADASCPVETGRPPGRRGRRRRGPRRAAPRIAAASRVVRPRPAASAATATPTVARIGRSSLARRRRGRRVARSASAWSRSAGLGRHRAGRRRGRSPCGMCSGHGVRRTSRQQSPAQPSGPWRGAPVEVTGHPVEDRPARLRRRSGRPGPLGGPAPAATVVELLRGPPPKSPLPGVEVGQPDLDDRSRRRRRRRAQRDGDPACS